MAPQTLRRRLKEMSSKIEGGGHNKKLNKDDELVIIQHIKLLEDFDIVLRSKFLRDVVNSILRLNYTNLSLPPLEVGIN